MAIRELVARIKALKEANTVESAPERSANRRAATIEESVTTRIRNRALANTASQPETTNDKAMPVDEQSEMTVQPGDDPPASPRTTLFTLPPAPISQPHVPLSHEQRVTRKKSRAQEQIRLC